MGETTLRPRWRWWLFCFLLWASWGRRWGWLDRLYSWSVRPEWVADPEDLRGERALPEAWR